MTDTPLVPVNAVEAALARTNGWPVYSVTTTATHEYAPPNYATPRVTYPSKLAPPAVAAGLTRALFEDFTGVGIDYTVFGAPAYQGAPGGTHGMDLTSHAVQKGDSLLRLQFYSDPTANDAADNNNAGAGLQTTQAKLWPVGSTFHVCMRIDANPNVVGMALLMGQHWPPELDIIEGGQAHVHWGAANSQLGFNVPAVDQSQWHVWGVEWTKSAINFTLDGNVWQSTSNPTSDPTDVNGLLQPMFLSLQIQDGDPSYPAAPIPQASLVEMDVDWIAIDVPA